MSTDRTPQTDPDAGDLGETDTQPLSRAAGKGAVATMIGQGVKISIHFAGLLILARLLEPDDYGLIAMVVAVTAMGDVVRDFGLSSAAVQARNLSDAQRTALFWINTLIGAVLMLIVFLAAGPIAALYDQPDLTTITRVLSVTFLLNGLATQFRADLNRDMRFVAYSVSDVGGHLTGLVLGVVAALLGAGPWALVAQQVGQKGGVLVLSAGLSGRAPGRPRRGVPVRSFLSFGGHLMVIQLIANVSRSVDSFIIGLRFGPSPLGVYDRAFQLLMLPLNQLSSPTTTVALPVLARLRDQKERFDAYLLRGQGVMMHMVMGVFAFSCAAAWPLIPLVLGDQWGDAVDFFRILAVGGMFHAATYACYWVMLAKGLTKPAMPYQVVNRLAMIVVIVAAGFVSPTAVAVAYAGSLALSWPFELWWLSRLSNAPTVRMFANGIRSMFGYGLAGVAAYATTRVAADLPEAVVLLLAAGAMAAVMAVEVAVWSEFRRDLAGAVRQVLAMMPRALTRRLPRRFAPG